MIFRGFTLREWFGIFRVRARHRRQRRGTTQVVCVRCERRIRIRRAGVTLCPCGIRHTFVPSP